MQSGGKRSHRVSAKLQRWAFRARVSKAKAEAGSPEWPVKAAARDTLTALERGPRLLGPWAALLAVDSYLMLWCQRGFLHPERKSWVLGRTAPGSAGPGHCCCCLGDKWGVSTASPPGPAHDGASPPPAALRAETRQRVAHSGLEKATQQPPSPVTEMVEGSLQLRQDTGWRPLPTPGGDKPPAPRERPHTEKPARPVSLSTCVSAQLSPRPPSPQVWG